MSTKQSALERLLADRAVEIVDEAVVSLARAHQEHYEAAGQDVSRLRLSRLHLVLVEALKARTGASMVAHAQMLARDRFFSGYDLREVQTAINVLEEAVWRVALKEIEGPALGDALARVSTILGMGKDALARAYVDLAAKERASAVDCDALFRGAAGR